MLNLSIRWGSSLREVGAEAWDELAITAGFYSSAGWLISYESDPTAEVRYLLVEDGDGLVAGLPLYDVARESNQRYRVPGSTEQPPLIAGPRRGYRSGTLLRAGLTAAETRQVAEAVQGALRQVVRERQRPLWWMFVPTTGLPAVELCGGTAARHHLDDEAYLAVPSGGFDEYASQLSTARRAKVRRERRRFLQAGLDVAVEALADMHEEAAPLLAHLEHKYGSDRDVDFYRFYLSRFLQSHDHGEVLTCRSGGRLLAFCHFFDFGDTLWGRTVGFDYDRLPGAFEYFNLTYYELIELGVSRGKKHLHLGMGSLDAKIRHGAVTGSLWAVQFDPQAPVSLDSAASR